MATAAQNVAQAPTREWATGPKEVEVVRGNNYLLTNVICNLTHLPNKLAYWNFNAGLENAATETLMKTVNFLEENNLQEVAAQSGDNIQNVAEDTGSKHTSVESRDPVAEMASKAFVPTMGILYVSGITCVLAGGLACARVAKHVPNAKQDIKNFIRNSIEDQILSVAKS